MPRCGEPDAWQDAPMAGDTPRADRPLAEPAASRLSPQHPLRAEILEAHARSMAQGDALYVDPGTGLSVLTARYLADRGYCCERGCRHCPYVTD
jgi:hypothetical protein